MDEIIVTTLHYKRKNINISWGPLIKPAHIEEHYDKEYKQCGYLLQEETKISDDGLILTRKLAWRTLPDISKKYKNDQIIKNYFIEVRDYIFSNQIVPSITPASFAAAQQLLEAGIVVNPFRKIQCIDEF